MQKLNVFTQQKSEHHGTRYAVKFMLELTPSYGLLPNPSRDRPQVEVCDTILTADGFPRNDKATANILGSRYQKMSRLTFNKADKNTERQAKLAVHKCRNSDLCDPVFLADFSMH
ncbi:hypothetical protein TNIN_33921 [Trichonephila inaurata madagascariensis]|uniref:Uncharacterized protein n=1 Tax=Trichonephila inaurata madagascariensis TaxID=2747483 RepID=A0A8X6ICX2_9ARAC|nr:hypothetical protein TNIN_33921 [Trichonephila inaurata madagascariensis]